MTKKTSKKDMIKDEFYCQHCKKHLATKPHSQKDTMGHSEHVLCAIGFNVNESMKVFINTSTTTNTKVKQLQKEFNLLSRRINSFLNEISAERRKR